MTNTKLDKPLKIAAIAIASAYALVNIFPAVEAHDEYVFRKTTYNILTIESLVDSDIQSRRVWEDVAEYNNRPAVVGDIVYAVTTPGRLVGYSVALAREGLDTIDFDTNN